MFNKGGRVSSTNILLHVLVSLLPCNGVNYFTDNNTDPDFKAFVKYTKERWKYTYP